MRNVLTAPAKFYCDSISGNIANDGLSQATALPQPQDVFNRLYQQYDLGGMPVDVYAADGQTFQGISLNGLIVGQAGPNVTFHCGSAFGKSVVAPNAVAPGQPGPYCLGLSFGAMLTVLNATFDNTRQIAQGGLGNDVVALGQGSRLIMTGTNKICQNTQEFNFITLYGGSSLDIVNSGGGSHLHWFGGGQCGMQLDAASFLQADTNGQHGLIAFWADGGTGGYPAPWFTDAFVDVAAACKCLLYGVDFHGSGEGYRYRIREGGVLDLNLSQDANQVNALFGSASTAWPVQGYLV